MASLMLTTETTVTLESECGHQTLCARASRTVSTTASSRRCLAATPVAMATGPLSALVVAWPVPTPCASGVTGSSLV